MNFKKILFLGLVTLFFLPLSLTVFAQTETTSANSPGFIQGVINRITGDAQRAFDNFNRPTNGPGYRNEAVFPNGSSQPSFTQSGVPTSNSYRSGTDFVTSNNVSCNLSNINNLRGVLVDFAIGCILEPVIYLIIGISVVIFLWGVFKFVIYKGDDKSSAKEFILWGIVGLFVMVSLWGLVNILMNTFFLDNTSISFRQINLDL